MNTATTATETTAERPHARRSASSLGSLALCSGYEGRSDAKRTHWVTEQGNRGHEAMDTGDTGDLESRFEELMVQRCEAYAARFTELGDQVYNEIRLETIEGRWGYTDRLLVHMDNTADLIDWKFVRAKEVADAEINMQGKDYVVGIFEDPRFAAVTAIRVHFVMPRLGSATSTPVPFTRADIPTLKLEILTLLRRAQHTDSKKFRGGELHPHYDVCKYCKHAGRCVALRKIADKIGRSYDPDGYGKQPEIPWTTHASQVKTPEERGQLQQLASLMDEWVSSVRHHNLTASLESAENLPAGYQLDYVKARRRVVSASALLAAAQEFGVTTQDLIDAATLSWGKVESALKERAPRGEKGRIVAAFTERTEELGAVDRPEPTPRLVRTRPPTV